MIKTQRIAASVVEKVLAGASLTAVLQALWQLYPALSSQQRGAIQDLSYGVLRFYGQLDALLGLLLKKSLQDRKLYFLLLVSLYQLEYSKTPSHAVVDHAVSASRFLGGSKRIPGLVNAILRNFIRQHECLLQQVDGNDVGRYSHPQWWIDKLRTQYPHDFQAILAANNKRPPMTLRVNQRKISVADYQALLDKKEMKTQLLWCSALQLVQPVNVKELPGFSEGWVSVQDAGAQLAAPFLNIQDGMRVLDACAAPGGKSTHLLELGQVALTVLDNDATRLARVAQNLERSRVKAARLICGDAAYPAQWWDGKPFDRILADVPCSASGVVCRHPDIKWLRRERDLAQFVVTQQKILNALWLILARGGQLLYVTCSVFAEENQCQMEKFLCHHSNAQALSLSGMSIMNGQLLPNMYHDGFFYTLLHKT
ncbi:16S rRNA (cytosine967-C5)-methyltransferase [Nitrosomonas cryotolerans]|uniref:16S rRNA (cytosine(967)-C(5))-methyltransferase n=1 Tax=Nitrosomonas cryotolerans ATCC 49181 TaxID=1131553 RepID=A0A1N6GYL3_9PROT|nr:16S rRNA (cytosine(967)-C(5))-methyltransferase RsmB [Nitrosomonas cryotolerans]SFP87783.1 16S rRNA (cytosine967-C5)-methyltransferase [Nitrosomonas cryotolerans]SIO12620.1 16S rRNA (cytosine967-C5)-methyltransferase [Nitrosomonas cryotolerans ATCC 49181]